MKALIVDDSKTARFMLSKAVKGLGLDPIEAGDGREAFAKLQETPGVQVALVDWNMPVMNGIELVRLVRSHAEFAAVKIVMVTTETDMSRVVEALESGANDYVMKPFSPEMIEEKLRLVGIERIVL